MRVVAVDYRVARWPIQSHGAARQHAERTSVIVAVRDETGATGLGEAAPLPGMSIDAVADAVAACDVLATQLPLELDTPTTASAIADRITPAPAARFAIETALLALLAQRAHTSIARLLAPIPQAELAHAIVVDDKHETRTAAAAGARCLKIKAPSPADLVPGGVVDRVARAASGLRLRIDANRGWPRETARRLLAELAELARDAGAVIDYVEEPCREAHLLLAAPVPMPRLPLRIALDESLVGLAPAQLARALASPHLAALVLKPTLLGGFARCLELAAAAHAHGVAPIVSHALEGAIGTAACRELARAIGADLPVGLAPHPAELAPQRPLTATAIVAAHTDETVAAIRAAFAERRPLALIHAKAAPAEQARQRALIANARLLPDDAIVLFSSGSTGPPRGVVLSRQALIGSAQASAWHLGWRDDDCWLACLPLAHAGGLSIVIRCLLAEKPLLLGEASDIDRVTIASLVPAQLAQLLDDPAWRPAPQLRAVLLGGAAAPPPLIAAALARGVPVLPTYGLTETFGQVATARVPGGPPVPLPGVEIAAGTREAPAPIRIRGPMLASRYLDGAPIAPELVTADLGFVDDGALTVVGRGDDVIISGGENVHPTQVEAVLAATPGVRATAAFGVADARWGQLVAAALAVSPAFDRDAALAQWHAQLPPHARPRRLALVDELPCLPSGKLDRRRIAALATVAIDYAGATGLAPDVAARSHVLQARE
jgi:o-succinylbenzoate---CoA ligase